MDRPERPAPEAAPDGPDPDWSAITRRNARSVQTTIGWIFWDPGAVARYQALGLNGPLGYLATRGAPFAGAGPEAMAASFGSISPVGIAIVFSQLGSASRFLPFWEARNQAVLEGLAHHAPDLAEPLADFGPDLWRVAEQLPVVGRPFAASHLGLPRPPDPVLSGWHAVNYLREWRGDTHWALVAGQRLSGDEASVLHNAWLGYEGDWLSESRGNSPESIAAAWAGLERRGLATDRVVNDDGIALRQWLEDETDRCTTLPWERLGQARSVEFATRFEPPCELLLRRVDQTAGPNYQPASRLRLPR